MAASVERVQAQAKQIEGQSSPVESVQRVTNRGARPRTQSIERTNSKPNGCFCCGKTGHFAKAEVIPYETEEKRQRKKNLLWW